MTNEENMMRQLVRQLTIQKIAYGLLVMLIAAGLKYGYSQASSEDLGWMLGPVASLVEIFTGVEFLKEAGIGYVSSAKQVAIVPACAGINFLVAAFCMTALALIYSLRRKVILPICIPAALAAAYGATLCANSLRIMLSMDLYHADIYTALITPERIHRIAGIAIYFICLSLLYLGTRKVTALHAFSGNPSPKDHGGRSNNILLTCLTPLAWYLSIALVLPAFNSAYRKNPSLFVEHSGFVLAVSFLLFILMFIGIICYKSLQPNRKPDKTYETAHSDRRR